MRKLSAQKEQLISAQEEEESISSIDSEDIDPHKAPPLCLPPTELAPVWFNNASQLTLPTSSLLSSSCLDSIDYATRLGSTQFGSTQLNLAQLNSTWLNSTWLNATRLNGIAGRTWLSSTVQFSSPSSKAQLGGLNPSGTHHKTQTTNHTKNTQKSQVTNHTPHRIRASGWSVAPLTQQHAAHH